MRNIKLDLEDGLSQSRMKLNRNVNSLLAEKAKSLIHNAVWAPINQCLWYGLRIEAGLN